MKKILSHPACVLPVVALFLRFWSFFPPVIDHDESTYLIIAKELLNGKVYLKDVIDTKPIGIFWIYQILELLAFHSIFIIRLLAALVIGFTSLLIFKFVKKETLNESSGWFAGISYILLLSIYKTWGMSPNTELFFNFFNLLGIYTFLYKKKHLDTFKSGLFFGIAFIIKFIAIAELGALVCYLLFMSYKKQQLNVKLIQLLAIGFLGFSLPVLCMYSYFYYHGIVDKFYYFSFEVLSRYPSTINFSNSILFIADFSGRFFPWTLLCIWALKTMKNQSHNYLPFYIFWILFDLIIIVLPGKGFSHYFIQLMLPVSILSGFRSQALFSKFVFPHAKRILTYLGISLALCIFYLQKVSYFNKPQDIVQIKDYLKSELKPGDKIYTGNSAHILYYVLNLESPTPYIHSSLLWNPEHIQALQIDPQIEFDKILNSKPTFILLKEPLPDSTFLLKIKDHYSEVKWIPRKTHIFRRRDL